jgi:2-polyprenyl-3-methyl-5-hydroxy-6-metoxy-1,4-benzoquinol methylase
MTKCPYCRDSGDLYFAIDYRTYHRCLGCDLIYQILQESRGDVLTAYREDYFERFSVDQTAGSRNTVFTHALDLIETKKKRGRLLDVGTGCGFFLATAHKRRWEAKGVEPSIQSVEVARKKNCLDVFYGTFMEYDGDGQFDVITFINVLDHSAMPWREIEKASQLLCPGGLVYLRFPNGLLHSRIYSMAQKCGLTSSLRKFLVFHNYLFTPQYIVRLLSDHGFVKTSILISPPSEGDPHRLFPAASVADLVKRLIYSLARATETISIGRLLLGTSLEVTAIKPDNHQPC